MKRAILIGIGAIVLLLFILIFLPVPFHEVLTQAISSPCGYVNMAWGEVRGTCVCTGITIDTSCPNCFDTGSSNGCIGIVRERHCYQTHFDGERREVEIPCA